MTQPTTVACQIRWMLKPDMPHVLDVSDFSFEEPWDAATFKAWLSERNTIGWVAEGHNGKIIGYMVYRLYSTSMEILNIAVHPQHRGLGVGSAFLKKLQRKLIKPASREMRERNRLRATVVEVDMGSLLFFKANGFSAAEVDRNAFEVRGEKRDGYVMEWEK